MRNSGISECVPLARRAPVKWGKAPTGEIIPDALVRIMTAAPQMCSPHGVGVRVSQDHDTKLIDIGWTQVKIPLRKGRREICFVRISEGRHHAHYSKTVDGRRRRFGKAVFTAQDDIEPFSEAYYENFVRACEVPFLSDFERQLVTLDGGPLGPESEGIAAKRARRKAIPYTMPDGWFMDMYREQKGLCALSGLPMYREAGKLCHKLPVPDRIDCTLGYEPGNVRLLRHGVNMMRRDLADAEFLELCRSVVDAQGTREFHR